MKPNSHQRDYHSSNQEQEMREVHPTQRYKLEETRTLILEGIASKMNSAESVFTDLSINIGTSIPDEVEIQGDNVMVKYPSVQAAVSVYEHLNGEMNVAGQNIKVQYFPIRKIDLTVAYDWYCQKCDYKNFARRNKCYRCQSDKSATCKLSYSTQPTTTRPFREESAQNCSLMIRGAVLCDVQESTLLELFESIAPVKDVRQIRNKLSGKYKDFAFIEFFTPEETSIAYRQANESRFRVMGERVTVMYSRNKSDDDYFKPLPYQAGKRERKAKDRPMQEDNYYHRQRQRQIEEQKARPSITMEQLKEKRQQELKKQQQSVPKKMNQEQSERRKAELLAKQWQRQMKTKEVLYVCPICVRKFPNADQLKLHQKMSQLHAFRLAEYNKSVLSI